MKILIFSDTHLDSIFDESKFNFLRRIIDSSDQVIINGDFWDSWFTSFDGFIKSKWSNLFPLLLKKKAVYIYGNHDPKEKCDHRVNLFSTINTENYFFNFNNQTYNVKHGRSILKGKRTKYLEIYGLILDKTDKNIIGKVLHYFLHFLEYIGYKLIGTSLMTNSEVAKHGNLILKQSCQNREWLICGDTHCAEIDKNSLFINSGCINYGHASYILINDNQINLYKENY